MSFKKTIVFFSAIIIAFSMSLESSMAQDTLPSGRAAPKKSAKYKYNFYKFDKNACDRYKGYIKQMYKQQDLPVNYFTVIRASYPRCDFYDPFAEATIGKLLDLIEKTRSEDPQTVIAALNEYKQTVRKHAANLTVLDFAVDFAQQDPRLGNLAVLKYLRKGIRDNLSINGNNGRHPNKAYDVITIGEEDYILSLQTGEIVNQEMGVSVGDKYYNVYDFSRDLGAVRYAIFIDVTKPIKAIQMSQSEETDENNFRELSIK